MIVLGLLVGGIVVAVKISTGKRNDEEGYIGPAIWLGVKILLFSSLIGVLIKMLATVWTRFIWYQNMGQIQIFGVQMIAKLILFFVVAVISLVVLTMMTKGVTKAFLKQHDKRCYTSTVVCEKVRIWVMLITSVVIGVIATFKSDLVLQMLYQQPFGTTDPIFGLDLGYYVFTLPFLQYVWHTAIFLVCLGTAYAGILLAMFYSFYEENSYEDNTATYQTVLRQLMAKLGVVVLTIAAGLPVARLALLVNGTSDKFSGASYTDVMTRMPWILVFMVISIVLAVFFMVAPYVIKSWKPLAWAGGVYVFILLLALAIVPGLTQGFVVNPSELVSESPFIQYNIAATRKAFLLDDIAESKFLYQKSFTGEEFLANESVLDNTRVMDWRALLTAENSLQTFRQYYRFTDIDMDRYDATEVMIGVRELDISQLSQTAQNWSNEHLQYTHGDGYTVSGVSEVDDNQGLPEFTVSDLPVVADHPYATGNTRIYFGELTDNWIVLNTKLDEFGSPTETGASYERYVGEIGVQMTPINRLMVSIRYHDLKLLLSQFVTSESRIVYGRGVMTRLASLCPGVSWDSDPYPILGGDEILWMVDGYTTTSMYPYSTSINGYNYIRNAVKATVGAYTGQTTCYVMDTTDPIMQTLMAVYPNAYTPASEMPELVRVHIRYPEDMFVAQATQLALYHMTDPVAFYNSEDKWIIPQELYLGTTKTIMDPRYVMLERTKDAPEEFILMIPYTPATKDTLVGWLAVGNDADQYGKFTLWTFPHTETVQGPSNIEGLINQNEEISADVSLWDQKQSTVMWGNLMTIPVTNDAGVGTIVYIKPLFIQSESGKIPTLARVIIVVGDRLIYENTLQDALTVLYTGKTTVTSTPEPQEEAIPSSVQDASIALANQYFLNAQACAEQGDWACYGENMDLLGSVLSTLLAQGGAEN